MKLIIEDDEGRKTVVPIVREDIDITIGRHEENTIRLTERNVSRRHAKLSRRSTNVWVEDLGSYNGVRVNGDRIKGRIEVKEGDLIQIGDYDLAVQLDGAAAARSDTVQNTPVSSPAAAGHTSAPHPAPAAPAPAARANGADGAHTPAAQVPRRIEPTSVIKLSELEHTQRPIVDIPPDQAPKLILVSTPLAGREYAFIRSELTIGRTDDNDIAIDHRSLSRNHSKIFRDADGSWKILDLQSANGVKVNGEVYGQSTLKFGDFIELGHAKFQFIGPGEEATLGHERGRAGGKAFPIKLVGIGVAALAVIGGGAALYVIKSKPKNLPVPDSVEKVPPPLPATTTAKTPPASKTESGANPAGHDDYARGMKLLGEQKFEEAAKELRAAKEAGNADAESALAKADAESAAGKALQDAQDKVAKKDWDGARFSAEQIPADSVFAGEAKKLLDKIEKSEKAVEKTEKTEKAEKTVAEKTEAVEKKAPPPKGPPREKKPEKGGNKEEAKADVEKGMALLRQQQPKEAAHFFELALKADPTLLKLHKALGSCYAQMNDNAKSAEHYRKYIEAFPTASDTPAIRENLRMYDQEHTKPGDE